MRALTEYQEEVLEKILLGIFGDIIVTFIKIDPKLDEFKKGKSLKLNSGIFCIERSSETFFAFKIPDMDINMKALIPDLANEIPFCGGTTGSVGWGFTIPPQRVSKIAEQLG